jgi:hypothetical protein
MKNSDNLSLAMLDTVMRFSEWMSVIEGRLLQAGADDIIFQTTNRLGWQISFVDETAHRIDEFQKRFPSMEVWVQYAAKFGSSENNVRLRRAVFNEVEPYLGKMGTQVFQEMLRQTTAEGIIQAAYQKTLSLKAMPGIDQQKITQDLSVINKAIDALHSIGLRKYNRVPIVVNYVGGSMRGNYQRDGHTDRIDINLNPAAGNERDTLYLVCHEIGHAIYTRLGETERRFILDQAYSHPSLTDYTALKPKGAVTAHSSGEEWFADYVFALATGSHVSPRQAKALPGVRKAFAGQKSNGQFDDREWGNTVRTQLASRP